MNVEGFLGSEEERAARRLIEQANGALERPRRRRCANGFVARLFAHAAPEDLVGYSPEELAAIAEQAWQFLQTRKPGSPKIRFANPETPPGGARLKGISIIEIVNDDMPFLVDSVMSALAEQNLSIRLVVHPILTVTRDASGALTALHDAHKADDSSLRESFIHIHVERIDDDIRRTEAIQDLEQSLVRRPSRRDGLASDARPRRRSDRGAQEQSAAAAGGRNRGSDPVPGMADREQFHVPRHSRASSSPPTPDRSMRWSRPASASCATRSRGTGRNCR